MNSNRNVFVFFICLLSLGCDKKFIRTDIICNHHLFLEVYEKWSQIGVSYLTDSTNFKIFVGQINFENEYYEYECTSDNLVIIKYSKNYFNQSVNVIERKKYMISELKREGKFQN